MPIDGPQSGVFRVPGTLSSASDGTRRILEFMANNLRNNLVLDLKNNIQNVNGYGDQPFSFLEPEAQQLLGDIVSIDLIENGDRSARENWQKKQLSNLINHAYV